MTGDAKLMQRLMSILLCAVMLLSVGSVFTTHAHAAGEVTLVADPSTMDGWKAFFPKNGSISTENAGGVWMDKSVFTSASAFPGTGVSLDGDDSFLVALSAIASNKAVSGMSYVPTDTMLVLDVSGSMNDDQGNNDVAEELAEAANDSIATLLAANPYNRVGVVLYSGTSSSNTNSDASVLLLPLGRYTTGSDGVYVSYSITSGWYGSSTTETISVDRDVRVEGTNNSPSTSSTSKNVTGATYIQKGIILAMQQFTADDHATTVTDPVLGTLRYKPIVVLMSDGAPTLGDTDFTAPGQYDLGNGSTPSAQLSFVTQLSAAYAKAMIETKYGTSALFYTLGLGINERMGSTQRALALSVLDPGNAGESTAVNDFWDDYDARATGGTVVVEEGDRWDPDITVTKIATKLEQDYVDRYFPATGNDPAAALTAAFKEVLDEIQLQSGYYPTLISENEDLSGYVSFVDRVGEYMEVRDIKGILINNTLFSGADLARNFVSGGGNLGTYDNPTELGQEMVSAVGARLGITDTTTATQLIGLAYEHGQISYRNDNDFSNYIGWYANAAGQYLGFYHEGLTELPAATGNTATDPVFTVRSYGYLGHTDASQGVSESDMMYTTVQVRENIATGEEYVAFAVPAALLPVVTYNVTLNESSVLENLQATGADYPICLVYEVGLESGINAYNVHEVVSAAYLADPHSTNADGSINFYTNQWDHNNTTNYGTVNAYSYFNPSRQNDRYYYLEDTPIYTNTAGALYTGSAQPTGVKYRAYTVYSKSSNGTLSTSTAYRQIPAEALTTARRSGDGSWYIPKGNVRVDLEGYTLHKTTNATGTLTESNIPFVDTMGHSIDSTGYRFYVGATLGNNGRLSLLPETGISLSKTMAPGVAAPDEAFTFRLTNTTNAADNTSYPAQLLRADGSTGTTQVRFANGSASVNLKAGETLYIGGMSPNTVLAITEEFKEGYVVSSATGLQNGRVTVTGGVMTPVSFVNNVSGTGNVTITKRVQHWFGTDYVLPDREFTITVTLVGQNVANRPVTVKKTGDAAASTITTNANGSFEIRLKHEEQLELFGLPEGMQVKVEEPNPGLGFTVAYWEKGETGDGEVTVEVNSTIGVTVHNMYQPLPVDPVMLQVHIEKQLQNKELQTLTDWADRTFTVLIERYNGTAWETVQEVVLSNASKELTVLLENEKFDAPGVYAYQIYEKGLMDESDRLPGIFYDNAWYTFSVHVSDPDMNGRLQITRLVDARTGQDIMASPDGMYLMSSEFTNVEYDIAPAAVILDIQKRITAASGAVPPLSGYKFSLYTDPECTIPATTGNGIVEVESTQSDDAGEGWIDVVLDKEGSYTFYMKEDVGSVPGITYSNQVVKVVIDVTRNETQRRYEAKVTYDVPTNAAGMVEFTNTYAPEGAELEINFVDKQLTGRAMKAGEFAFEVQPWDYVTGTAGAAVLKGTNDANGNVIFDSKLTFDKVGTYVYQIVETTPDGNGVTSDKTIYRINVVVTNANGRLAVRYSLTNAVGDDILFQNSYTPTPVSHNLSGRKYVVGSELINDGYAFVLTEVSYNGAAYTNPASRTVRNFADGTFTFTGLTYDRAGTYVYSLREERPASVSSGMVYDTTEYRVTVNITDDNMGKLHVGSVAYATADGTPVSALTFTNRYQPSTATAQITGTKQLNGMPLTENAFTFELYASDAGWNRRQLMQSVANAADGKFAFNEMTFSSAGDYYFLVAERTPAQPIPDMQYDDTVYRVRVEITDDHRGVLRSRLHFYNSAGIPQDSIRFVNTYGMTDAATVTLSGMKHITGREWTADDAFSFELYATDDDYLVGSSLPLASGTANQTVRRWTINLTYDAADIGRTYYYVVREANAGQTIEGMTFSSKEHHVRVDVTDNGSGGVQATVTATSGAAADALDFTNTYDPDLVPPAPDIPETGDGMPLGVWMTVLFLSAAALTALLCRNRRVNGK